MGNKINLGKIRERKELKRRQQRPAKLLARRNLFGKQNNSSKSALHNYKRKFLATELFTFLHNKDFFDKKLKTNNLIVPKDFTFNKNYDESYLFIRKLFSSLYFSLLEQNEDLTISFKECKDAGFGVLHFMNILLIDHIKMKKNVERHLNFGYELPEIIIDLDMNPKINNKLIMLNFPFSVQKDQQIPISLFKPVIGRKQISSISENKKAQVSKRLREYINSCLIGHNLELNEGGSNDLEKLICEVLNNAEDHSIVQNWYVAGNLFESDRSDETKEHTGELNMLFVNFGFSIYEGFENTKEENSDIYLEMETLYQKSVAKFGKTMQDVYLRENLFTLYALQEGVSRLKYKEESRGTGTMTFIRSFMDLGDFCKDDFKPLLYILSGKTLLKCDNQYKPYRKGNKYFLSLNASQDIEMPPDKSHLSNLNYSFPGTMLLVKLYINEDHLLKKLNHE